MKKTIFAKTMATLLAVLLLAAFMPAGVLAEDAMRATAPAGEAAPQANDAVPTYTVTYNANGGTEAAPAQETGLSLDDVVTLPEYTGTSAQGGVFLGWSPNKNAGGKNNFKEPIYGAGAQYPITANLTLYAVFANIMGADTTVVFYVRLDDTIPFEPDHHPKGNYTGGITVKDALDLYCFTTNAGSFGIGGENGVLKSTPTDEQVKAAVEAAGSTYDAESQYVRWYVSKWESDGWHVDGVLMNKNDISLIYDQNCSRTAVVENMPQGQLYPLVGEAVDATISGMVPTRYGYTFTGWNTSADGTGAAVGGDSILTITQDTVLYAQWAQKTSEYYAVEYYLEDTANPGTFILNEAASDAFKVADLGQTVSAEEKTFAGYAYSAGNTNNVQSGVVTADEKLVLKRYYTAEKYTVTYDWGTLLDGKTLYAGGTNTVATPTLPTNANAYFYKNAVPVDTTYTNATVYDVQDAAGNVKGSYTFSGWDKVNNFAILANTTITGTWVYTPNIADIAISGYKGEYDADEHNVTVSGTLPDDEIIYTLPDGTVLTDGLVNVTPGTDVTATVKRDGEVIWKKSAPVIITPAPLTITLDDKTQVYGEDEVGLTYNDKANVITAANGLKGADAAFATPARAAGTDVDSYAIGADVTFTTGAASNYTITVVPGTYTITPADITIRVNGGTKVQGANDPAFTGTITVNSGKVAEAVLGTAYSRAPGEAVGSYATTATYATSKNYVVHIVDGVFTITAPVVPVPTPDPGPTPPPTTPPTNPRPTPPTTTPTTPPGDDPVPTEEPIPAEPTPLVSSPEEEVIEEETSALASGAAWALVNFALMNLAVFEALMLCIGYFVNTKNQKEENEAAGKKLKKKGLWRAISLPVGIISIIAFCLTEDITLPTAFVDKWTWLMAVIAVAQTVLVLLSRKKVEDDEQQVEEEDLEG